MSEFLKENYPNWLEACEDYKKPEKVFSAGIDLDKERDTLGLLM